MRLWAWMAGLAALLAAQAAWAGNVGFERVTAPAGADKPLVVGIWYPTDAPEAPMALGPSSQVVALGAPVAGANHPLILISHGTGGSFGDHFDTAKALAQAGFIVAAVSHTGDTYDDRSRTRRISERPGHLTPVIDYMTTTWRGHDAIDARRIGAFGFSAGGFTVLGAIGGEIDLSLMAAHCRQHPHFYDCATIGKLGEAPPAKPAPVSHDARIKAAVVAAPAMGFAFAPAGLAKVTVPVQLWRAEWDTVLPQPYYAEVVHGLLPKAEYRLAPHADHFDFLPPCSDQLAKLAPDVCVSNIDRAAFHKTFNAEVVRFFKKTLD
ncbi:alpha/beta hydrolase family protein [Phenylobacterium sp.]|uniref:alpha/beta hydrolase family protein n=1 Tax=Phenylobacterium sp. TaxID=1871053 RepID=UPI002DE264B0|nr:prolyl oligopeptidase family serine peptidase [Phenylobacterium sp.]